MEKQYNMTVLKIMCLEPACIKNRHFLSVSLQKSVVNAGKTIFVSCQPEINGCKYLLLKRCLLCVNKYVVSETEKSFCVC